MVSLFVAETSEMEVKKSTCKGCINIYPEFKGRLYVRRKGTLDSKPTTCNKLSMLTYHKLAISADFSAWSNSEMGLKMPPNTHEPANKPNNAQTPQTSLESKFREYVLVELLDEAGVSENGQ